MGTRSRKPAAPALAATPAPARPPIPKVEGISYSSLRIIGDVHKLRFATSSKLVNAGDGQTITFCEKPFEHFKVMPSGVEIPLQNVTSAIPTDAALLRKLTHKSRLEARAESLESILKAKEAEAEEVGIQDVPDDYVDQSTDDEPEEAEASDGIDV